MGYKQKMREFWPNSFAVLDHDGWSVQGGLEGLEAVSLSIGQASELGAWEEAWRYYEEMVAQS